MTLSSTLRNALSPYLRLMRLHQPAGIWLLLWPCWWSVALAANGRPPVTLLALFGLGAVLMRSAGCIVNDIWDRQVDREVARTQTRPLASGELSIRSAIALLALLLGLALPIALSLNALTVVLAFVSPILVVLYPLMKRITWWPQAFLGLTFNWGALMGWSAVSGNLSAPAFALYAAGICWTLGYDTLYAHQDAKDDRRIGVKSTALLLGAYSKHAVAAFYAVSFTFFMLAGWLSGAAEGYYFFLLLAGGHFAWQMAATDLGDAESCGRAFKSNAALGWIIMAGCLAAGA